MPEESSISLLRLLASVVRCLYTDFQAFEVLAKPWGACISRPTPDQQRQRQQKRKRDTSPQPRLEADSDEATQEAQEDPSRPAAGSFPALLSHFLQQPLPTFLSDAPNPATPATAAPAAAPPEVSLESLSRISSYHYQLPMKGHTGYVALCVKPSEDEVLQPLP